MQKTKVKTTTNKRKQMGLPEVVMMLEMPETIDEAIKMSSPGIVLQNNNKSRIIAYQAKIRQMLEAKSTVEQIEKEMEGWKQPEPRPPKDKLKEMIERMSDEEREKLKDILDGRTDP